MKCVYRIFPVYWLYLCCNVFIAENLQSVISVKNYLVDELLNMHIDIVNLRNIYEVAS